MKTNLSISIMAHPSRKKYVKYLLEELGDVPVVYDKGKGLWDTCKNAWLLYDRKKTHHLVLQDDAILCSKFTKNAERVVKKRGDQAISFYVGMRRNFRGMIPEQIITISKEDGGFYAKGMSWGVAICLPNYLIKEMVKFGNRKKRIKQDDAKISKFLKRKRIMTWHTVPTLVDHRSELKSICYDDINLNRKSILFYDNTL